MKTELAPEAREFEQVVTAAIDRAGGMGLARRAERGEHGTAARVLDELGVWDLRPRTSELDAEVAAAVCRAAGRRALPYPVAARLAGRPDEGVDVLAVAGDGGARADLLDAAPDLAWWVSDGEGLRAPVTSSAAPHHSKLGPLVREVGLGSWTADADAVPLAVTLPCWTLLGMIEQAVTDTRRHMVDRQQFGRRLADFQALQFRLADTAADLQALTELAKYTVWSVASAKSGAAADAVGLRLASLETAETVFRTAHQMFGAMGFCDETDLSWLSRYSQPLRRLPWGRSETEARLLARLDALGFDGLFSAVPDDDPLLAGGTR